MAHKILKHKGTAYGGRVGAKMKAPKPTGAKKKPARDILVAQGGIWHGRSLPYSRGSGDAVTLPICVHGVCGQYMRYQDRMPNEALGKAYWVASGSKPSEGST